VQLGGKKLQAPSFISSTLLMEMAIQLPTIAIAINHNGIDKKDCSTDPISSLLAII
jgi:hypothetical protein